MKKLIATTATLIALAMPAAASELTLETPLGTSMDEVKAALADMGYEIRKSEIEDGLIEVYFVGNGQMGEVYVSPETGLPVKIALK